RPPFSDEAEYALRDGLLDPVYARGPVSTTPPPPPDPVGPAMPLSFSISGNGEKADVLIVRAGAGGSAGARARRGGGLGRAAAPRRGGVLGRLPRARRLGERLRLPGGQARVGARRRRAVE